MTIIAITAAIFVFDSPLFADVMWLWGGGTYNINTEITASILVDEYRPGDGTTVNLLKGGKIPIITMCEDSLLNVVDGEVTQRIAPAHRSQVNISGGIIGENPSFPSILAEDYSQTHISGGILNGGLNTIDYSQIYLSGGWVGQNIWTSNDSHVYISGGTINGPIYTFHNSIVDISGGNFGDLFYLDNSSTIIINGSNFAVDGVPFSGEILSITGDPWEESLRNLTGILASGELLDTDFWIISSDAKIILTPVPGTIILGLIGLGIGGWKLRKSI